MVLMTIARRLLQKKQQLDRHRPLEPFTVQRLHQELRLLATYHSNAIEGNTLSLRETQMVLEYGCKFWNEVSGNFDNSVSGSAFLTEGSEHLAGESVVFCQVF